MLNTKNSNAVIETQEKLLLEYLLLLEDHKSGRGAVHVNLSSLQQQNGAIYDPCLAADNFFHLIKFKKGQLFVIQNLDLFFVYKSEFLFEVQAALEKLFQTYSLEILPKSKDNHSNKKLLTYYNVQQDFSEMMRFLERSLNRKTLKD